jgi:hypothetical protein
MHGRIKCRERHAHVGRMRRDAGFARTENRMLLVDAIDRRTTGARLTFVAGRHGVVKIDAAGPLQQIAAGRCQVAQLLRGSRHDGIAEQRVAAFDDRVIGEVGVRHQSADLESAARRLLDGVERQTADIDQPRGTFDVLLDQVDEIGSAGDKLRAPILRDPAHRIRNVARARVLEIDHVWPPSITCMMAATMFL